jgi:diaminopimelate decarboxylase
MKEITLRLTDEEHELLDEFRRGRAREFAVYGEDVLAVDDGGGFMFSQSQYFPEGAPLIAAAFNGLFRSR